MTHIETSAIQERLEQVLRILRFASGGNVLLNNFKNQNDKLDIIPCSFYPGILPL